MRVLLVEDDRKVAKFIGRGLEEAGFTVDMALNGREGLIRALAFPYDVAVIDIMLPELDGLSLIEQLRNNGVHVPILILSAKRSVDERVRGLQAGGDDYLVKPFAFSELLARLQALLRRSQGRAEPTILRVGELTMDLISHTVRRGSETIELQAREFSLLEYLMRNAGHVVSRTMILEHVWGYDHYAETNVIEVRICRLREKLDKGHARSLIRSIRGVGYTIEEGA